MRRRALTAEHKAKISAGQRRRWATVTNRAMPEGVKAKISKAQKRRWAERREQGEEAGLSRDSTRLMRTSERTTFAACRWRWQMQYEERWAPKETAGVLLFGSVVHKVLELHYPRGRRRGMDCAELFPSVYEEMVGEQRELGARDENGEWADLAEMGPLLMEAYDQKWGADTEWEVIATELKFKVRVAPKVWYVGTIDAVMRHIPTQRVHLWDHKTAGEIWLQHLSLDEQFGSYLAYAGPWLRKAGMIGEKDELYGLVANYIRRATPDPRPVNEKGEALNNDGSISKRQQAPLFVRESTTRTPNSIASLKERVQSQLREMEMVRQGELDALKSPGRFNCTGCGMKPVCVDHEAGADYRLLLATSYNQGDPYSQYRRGGRG